MPHYDDLRVELTLRDPKFRAKNIADYLVQKGFSEDMPEREIAMLEAYYSLHDSEWFATGDKRGEVYEWEMRLSELLARIESEGIRIDQTKLRDIGERISSDVKRLEESVFATIGERINLGSPKQVQYLLFEKLGMSSGKKNKTGFSVDTETLEELGKSAPIALDILKHRSLKKLQSTYVEWLLKECDKNGVVRTHYDQLGAATGRMSSERPNLQNIPTGEWYADEIKACFVPLKEWNVLVVADYSQIELRVLAGLSEDEALIETFRNNEDIHERTAVSLFGETAKGNREMRRIAKSVNFGVIYGITGFGLSKMIHTPPSIANGYIDRFFAHYPKVKTYMETILNGARENGYVETAFGRRRHIRSINDSNKMIRSAAEREAFNMPIQGTAADIVKLAMLQLDGQLRGKFPGSGIRMQVHDELVVECPESDRQAVMETVRECLEHAVEFAVPLTVDIGWWTDWLEAKNAA